MRIASTRWIALLAGLLLLSLVVFVTAIQTAQAVNGTGSSTAASTPAAGTQGRGGVALVSLTPAAGTQGRGGVALAPVAPAARTQGRGGVALASVTPVTGAQPVASDGISTTAWIAAGSAAAVLIIGIAAWALTRRRRQLGDGASAAFCAQHPEDATCAPA